jgi:hypothetical protein
MSLHNQNKDGELVFRYDNAVYRLALGFKEHKHTKEGVVVDASLPDVSDIMDEAVGFL